jgi:hypothetical protein
VEANSTGGQGSCRAVAPIDDDILHPLAQRRAKTEFDWA